MSEDSSTMPFKLHLSETGIDNVDKLIDDKTLDKQIRDSDHSDDDDVMTYSSNEVFEEMTHGDQAGLVFFCTCTVIY